MRPTKPLPSNVNYYERNYDYDKLGNINSVVQTGTNGFTRDYTYNTGKNTLQKIENSTPTVIESYTYDNCGNTVTTNLNRNYVWNHADQLLSYYNQVGTSDPTVFTQYDYAGQNRVSKVVRTGTAGSPIYERTIYIDGIFEYVMLDNGTMYEKNYIHIMDDKSRIAEVRINPGTAFPGDITDDVTYILEDQIGSSVVRLSTTGTVIDEEEYYPFGDTSLRTFTYRRYRYVGKERDAESGLYYYGARYYAAWTCRFISVDPLASKFAQLTPYNYSENNPINDKDIDGMQKGSSTPSEQGKGNGSGSGGGNNNVVKPITNNIQLEQSTTKVNTVGPDPGALQAMKDIASGTHEMKQQIKKNNEAVKQSAEAHAKEQFLGNNDPQFWENKGNPEMANFVATKNAADKEGGAMGAMIWIGYASQKTGEYGSVIKAVGAPQKVQAPQAPLNYAPNAPSGRVTLLNDGKSVNLGGVKIINATLSGKTHPVTNVPFDKQGFPDFSANLYKGGANDVMIKPTGNRTSDFAAANKAAGYTSTPKGYTWHHHQTTGRMQLVETSIHAKTAHTGGFSIWKY